MNCIECNKPTYYEDEGLNEDDKLCINCYECKKLVDYDDAVYENDDAKDDSMLCINCFNKAVKINEDDNLCLECFNNDKYSETEGYAETIPLCMTCGYDEEDLVDGMYCIDCWKRQRFMHIFQESKTYSVGSYYGKHLLEKYLGYYISENVFIAFMMVRGYKYNEKKGTFKCKINKKKAREILNL